MQKNYRDYTVGELLDMGFDVDVYNHGVSLAEAEHILSRFEGVKRSSYTLKNGTQKVARGRKGRFSLINFIAKEETE